MSEGTETVAVGVEDKRVVLKFPKPISWAALDPDTALAVGEEMARSAYTVKYDRKALHYQEKFVMPLSLVQCT